MIVIKIGGKSLANLEDNIIPDLIELTEKEKAILVHGGADEVTLVARRLGKEQRFITSPEGVRSRYTDEEDIRIYTMVMAGLINKRIVSALNHAGLSGVGISGLDACTIRGSRRKRLIAIDERGRKVAVEGGYTGKIDSVDARLINNIINNGYLPVISPLAIGQESEALNVDSDAAAAAVAVAVGADRLLFMTNVEGLQIDGSLVRQIRVADLNALFAKIGYGMNRKVIEARRAIGNGVKEVIIAQSSIQRPILRAIRHEVGTVIQA